jgi:hypothetical protein
MAPIIIKPSMVFAQSATFTFGSKTHVVDGAGGFERFLEPTQEKITAATQHLALDELVENFDNFSLSSIIEGHNIIAKMGSCEPALPSQDSDQQTRSPFGLSNAAHNYSRSILELFSSTY